MLNTDAMLRQKFPSISIKVDYAATRNRVGLIAYRVLVYTILILLTFLCLFPFYLLIINATRSHYEINTGISFWFGNNFIKNWNAMAKDTNALIGRAFMNSILIATSATALAVYFSCLTAYAFHTFEFKGKKVLFGIVLLIMMIPAQVSSLGFVNLCQRMNMMDTFWPLILPSICSPVVVFFMKQYLDSVMPHELVEAARVDGAGELRTFHQVALPIMKPAMAVQAIFIFVGSWNNYFLPQLIIKSNVNRTIPLIIASFQSDNPQTFNLGKVYMTMAVAIIPLLIVYLIFSKFIIKGVTLGSVKG